MHRTGTETLGNLAPVCEGNSPRTQVGESRTGVFVDCLAHAGTRSFTPRGLHRARGVRKCAFFHSNGEEAKKPDFLLSLN